MQPILVCMVWRGAERFDRCLASISASQHHFARIIISVASTPDSSDMIRAMAFKGEHPNVEVLCTQREVPTMQHQAFWIDYLKRTGAQGGDWIYWLAYDDEVRGRGIDAITGDDGNWPLKQGTVYFGPWAMRHEEADNLWSGDCETSLESWTSFPLNGPTRLPLMAWIADQINQPTYMQMSGSVCPFSNFLELTNGRPTKRGPMRIEMAVAAGRKTTHVEEFREPLCIIYGRPNSDRASYGKQARREDLHLVAWLARYTAAHPSATADLARLAFTATAQQFRLRAARAPLPQEEWRVRGECSP